MEALSLHIKGSLDERSTKRVEAMVGIRVMEAQRDNRPFIRTNTNPQISTVETAIEEVDLQFKIGDPLAVRGMEIMVRYSKEEVKMFG